MGQTEVGTENLFFPSVAYISKCPFSVALSASAAEAVGFNLRTNLGRGPPRRQSPAAVAPETSWLVALKTGGQILLSPFPVPIRVLVVLRVLVLLPDLDAGEDQLPNRALASEGLALYLGATDPLKRGMVRQRTMNVPTQGKIAQQRATRAANARSRRRLETLFKKAIELTEEGDTKVYLLAFRRGRLRELNTDNGLFRNLAPSW